MKIILTSLLITLSTSRQLLCPYTLDQDCNSLCQLIFETTEDIMYNRENLDCESSINLYNKYALNLTQDQLQMTMNSDQQLISNLKQLSLKPVDSALVIDTKLYDYSQ